MSSASVQIAIMCRNPRNDLEWLPVRAGFRLFACFLLLLLILEFWIFDSKTKVSISCLVHFEVRVDKHKKHFEFGKERKSCVIFKGITVSYFFTINRWIWIFCCNQNYCGKSSCYSNQQTFSCHPDRP